VLKKRSCGREPATPMKCQRGLDGRQIGVNFDFWPILVLLRHKFCKYCGGGLLKRFFFKKSQRLLSNDEFKMVLAHKCSVSNELVKLYVAENALGSPRLGISVSKACGNAVLRNRLKRLAREVFRLEQHNIPGGYDYLLIFSIKMSNKTTTSGKSDRRAVTFDNLRRSFVDLVRQGVARCDKN